MKRSARIACARARARCPPSSACGSRSAPCTRRSRAASSRIAYQRSASKSASSTMHGDAVGERRDDAVRRAGHPARIGRAPEDVVGVQVERAAAPVTWCATTASCTCTAPLGLPVVPLVKCSSASPPAIVRTTSNSGARRAHQLVEVQRAFRQFACARRANDQDVPQVRQLAADRRHLAPIQQVRRDQHAQPSRARAAPSPAPDRTRRTAGSRRRRRPACRGRSRRAPGLVRSASPRVRPAARRGLPARWRSGAQAAESAR